MQAPATEWKNHQTIKISNKKFVVQVESEPHTPNPESAMLTPNYKLSENAGKNEEFQKKKKN